MTLDVVDESCPERRHATQIVIFFPTIEMMPKVLVRHELPLCEILAADRSCSYALLCVVRMAQFVGDIIRFHRLEVKRYRDALQGMSSYEPSTLLLCLRSTASQTSLVGLTRPVLHAHAASLASCPQSKVHALRRDSREPSDWRARAADVLADVDV